jgi:predicted dehydrogenase
MDSDLSPARPLLIGLGPYALHSHLTAFRDLRCPPRAVIELESARSRTSVLLSGFGFGDCPVLTVPDDERDLPSLSGATKAKLDAMLAGIEPTHVFLACEPKGHRAYLEYFIPRGVRIFCEKPLTTVTGFSTEPAAAARVWQDWLHLSALAARHPASRVFLNTQRRFCPFYRKARETLAEVGREFGLPVTRLEIASCDGSWALPHEMSGRENHPFHYGYGKLMHSGYHFVDLLAYLLSATDGVLDEAVEVHASSRRPGDYELPEAFYRRVFPQMPPAQLRLKEGLDYGELDLEASLRFGRLTRAHLLLSSTGYCRRRTPETKFDSYRGQGRVRHERTDITLGPVLNIQFHDYQVDRSFDSGNDSRPEPTLMIFRNADLIGGAPFQRFTGRDLEGPWGALIKRKVITDFLTDRIADSRLEDHAHSIRLLSRLGESLAAEYIR